MSIPSPTSESAAFDFDYTHTHTHTRHQLLRPILGSPYLCFLLLEYRELTFYVGHLPLHPVTSRPTCQNTSASQLTSAYVNYSIRQRTSSYAGAHGNIRQHTWTGVPWAGGGRCRCRPRHSRCQPHLSEIVTKMSHMHPFCRDNLQPHAVEKLLRADTYTASVCRQCDRVQHTRVAGWRASVLYVSADM